MPERLLTITVDPSLRNLAGEFTKATPEWVKYWRNELRDLGRNYVKAAKEEAPGDKFPETIRFKTFENRGSLLTLGITALEPLSTFIMKGTKPHDIEAKKAPYLHFYWEKEGRWVRTKKVRHPGTKPNPFQERAFEKLHPSVDDVVKRMSVKYVALLA